ncbi:thioesterase II family protein [Streptomyces sp. KLOTTS4A1]|uniref:thioesterase II family protein n=1 Tax=Streptomyces sp. KLOTTS4A1 TaxID=3390996 RepID=UPI0039F61E6A
MTTTTPLPAAAADWLRPLHSPVRPRARLVCFPHAGGAASFFRDWPRHLAPDVEVLAVRYPGREDRIAETPARSMAELAGPVAEAIGTLSARPTAFFGHSMGASVAYETAVRLRATGLPGLLLVSGRAAPHRLPDFRVRDDEALIADVRRRGGPLAGALDHPDLLDLVLPSLRADYRLLEDYRAEAVAHRLGIPVAAFHGDADPDVPADAVHAWADVGSGTFTARAFPGDHFYLMPHARDLVGDIDARLTALSPAPVPERNL